MNVHSVFLLTSFLCTLLFVGCATKTAEKPDFSPLPEVAPEHITSSAVALDGFQSNKWHTNGPFSVTFDNGTVKQCEPGDGTTEYMSECSVSGVLWKTPTSIKFNTNQDDGLLSVVLALRTSSEQQARKLAVRLQNELSERYGKPVKGTLLGPSITRWFDDKGAVDLTQNEFATSTVMVIFSAKAK